MNENLTKTLPESDSEKLSLILSTVQAVAVRVDNVEQTVKLVIASVIQLQDGVQRLAASIVELQEGQQRLETDVARLQEGQQRLEEGQESLRSELREMRSDMNRRFRTLSGQTLAEVRDLQKRVTRLEQKSPPDSQT